MFVRRIVAPIILLLVIIPIHFANHQSAAILPPALQLTKYDVRQIKCLADNMFFEAGTETAKGKKAVALVTLNRVNSDAFPDSICGVVKQKTNHTCQFSWWCDAKLKSKSVSKKFDFLEKQLYDGIYQMATHIYINRGKMKDFTKGSLFYHADYVKPNWKNLKKTIKVDTHIFYTFNKE